MDSEKVDKENEKVDKENEKAVIVQESEKVDIVQESEKAVIVQESEKVDIVQENDDFLYEDLLDFYNYLLIIYSIGNYEKMTDDRKDRIKHYKDKFPFLESIGELETNDEYYKNMINIIKDKLKDYNAEMSGGGVIHTHFDETNILFSNFLPDTDKNFLKTQFIPLEKSVEIDYETEVKEIICNINTFLEDETILREDIGEMNKYKILKLRCIVNKLILDKNINDKVKYEDIKLPSLEYFECLKEESKVKIMKKKIENLILYKIIY